MKNENRSLIPLDIMTVHDLALYLKTSDAKVYRMARKRDLPAFRIGKSWRFKRNMIDMWISQKIIQDQEYTLKMDQIAEL